MTTLSSCKKESQNCMHIQSIDKRSKVNPIVLVELLHLALNENGSSFCPAYEGNADFEDPSWLWLFFQN